MFSLWKKKKKARKSIKCGNVEMSRVKEELGLLAVRNVATCITLACESHACRSTMEVLGKDEKPPFLVKYSFPRDHSSSESDRSKCAKLSEKSCKPMFFCRCIWMSRPLGCAVQWLCSARENSACPAKSKPTHSACSLTLGRL